MDLSPFGLCPVGAGRGFFSLLETPTSPGAQLKSSKHQTQMLWNLLREQERSPRLSPTAEHGRFWMIELLAFQTFVQVNLILSLRNRLRENERNRSGTESPSFHLHVCVFPSGGRLTSSQWGCQSHLGPYGHSSDNFSLCTESKRASASAFISECLGNTGPWN